MKWVKGFTLHDLEYVVVTLVLVGCGFQQKPMESLPPGMAYLQQAPPGRDYEAFIRESTIESERFRRRLLSGGDPNFISAELLAKAIMEFRRRAPAYLKGNKDIEGFDLSEKMIIEAISGTERIESRRAYGGFEGKLIWIMAGEVFLEETYDVSPGVQAYAITGFFYQDTENTLKTTRCFQAIYTRKPDSRPDWFSFPLELHILR